MLVVPPLVPPQGAVRVLPGLKKYRRAKARLRQRVLITGARYERRHRLLTGLWTGWLPQQFRHGRAGIHHTDRMGRRVTRHLPSLGRGVENLPDLQRGQLRLTLQ